MGFIFWTSKREMKTLNPRRARVAAVGTFRPRSMITGSSAQAIQELKPAIQPSLADGNHQEFLFCHGTLLCSQALHSPRVSHKKLKSPESLHFQHDTMYLQRRPTENIGPECLRENYKGNSWYKHWEHMVQRFNVQLNDGVA